jgi:hypothetical protein
MKRIWKEAVEKGTLSALMHTGYWRVYDTAVLKVRCLQAADGTDTAGGTHYRETISRGVRKFCRSPESTSKF